MLSLLNVIFFPVLENHSICGSGFPCRLVPQISVTVSPWRVAKSHEAGSPNSGPSNYWMMALCVNTQKIIVII